MKNEKMKMNLPEIEKAIARHLKEHGYNLNRKSNGSVILERGSLTAVPMDELILYGILPLICELTGQDHPDSDEERRSMGWLG